MSVNRLQAFVVLLMLALACLRAHAQPAIPVSPPLPDRELVIATREVPPFAIKRKDGSWHGISIALWHRIAERLHLRFRFSEQTTPLEVGFGLNAFNELARRKLAPDAKLAPDWHPTMPSRSLTLPVRARSHRRRGCRA
jgi:ABC-type amino acid transport substrate-binding protein